MSEPFHIANIPAELSVLPLRNAVLFPGGMLPMCVATSSPFAALDTGDLLVIVAQTDALTAEPRSEDLFEVGTLGRVQSVTRSGDVIDFTVHGLARTRLRYLKNAKTLRAAVPPLVETRAPESGAWLEDTRALALQILHRTPAAPRVARALVRDLDDPSHLVDLVVANIALPVAYQQRVLEAFDLTERLAIAHSLLKAHLAALPSVALDDAQCPLHQVPAVTTCERCGAFMCEGCRGRGGVAVRCRACTGLTSEPRRRSLNVTGVVGVVAALIAALVFIARSGR